MLLPKSSALYSIFNQKCPKCHQGDMYEAGMYNLRKFQRMPQSCDKCGQPFFLEPMFYEGAQYVSYAIQVALFVSWFVAFNVLFDEFMLVWFISSISVASVLMIPLNWRMSRVVWLHFFVKYDKQKAEVAKMHATKND
jgi:uncharacterized protein (DUF983 family)